MEKKESMLVDVSKGLVETEGAPRATGISTSGRTRRSGRSVWLFLIPRCLRRRFAAGSRQNTSAVSSGKRKPAKSRVGWVLFCVGRGCTPPI